MIALWFTHRPFRAQVETRHVARAIISACHFVGEKPNDIFNSRRPMRARPLAVAALLEAFPVASPPALARSVGYTTRQAPLILAEITWAKAQPWWSEGCVDEIVGQLVADHYGVQAT